MFNKISAFSVAGLILFNAIFPFQYFNFQIAKAEKAAAESAINYEDAIEYYVDTFIISAYYSPAPGQENYATGSYESDIYLNGNGTNGADGTEVYPGMIAAPKKYPFGTKMNIPGVGVVAVHDRGGAIVEEGKNGFEHDRLDIWMGYGDKGLERALSWGKRTVDVIVYGVNEDMKEQVYLEGYSEAEKFLQTIVLAPLNFPHDIYFGAEGEDVKKLQQYLKEWGYYVGEPNGFYGNETAEALYLFQLDYKIINGADELGAGHFGINTRRQFDKLIDNGVSDEEVKLNKGGQLLAKYSDLNDSRTSFYAALKLGDSNDEVRKLQEELVRLGFMRISPNGYYGDVTEHAVFKFQQSKGIVVSHDEPGAGYFGPETRKAMNAITGDRFKIKSLLAYQREQIAQGKLIVKVPTEVIAAKRED